MYHEAHSDNSEHCIVGSRDGNGWRPDQYYNPRRGGERRREGCVSVSLHGYADPDGGGGGPRGDRRQPDVPAEGLRQLSHDDDDAD